jgi:predicted acylesterase/phospholipase RssA
LRALVLSGGGALGAYEAGAISVLCSEIQYDLVCGTSIGALNAAYVAQNRLPDLEATWSTIGKAGVITLIPFAQRIQDFVDGVISFQKSSSIIPKMLSLAGLLPKFMRIGPMNAIMSQLGGLSPDPIASVLDKYVDFGRLVKPLIISGTDLTTGNSDAFYWFPDPAAGATFAKAHDKGVAHLLNAANIRDAVRASAAIPFAFAPVTVATDAEGQRGFVDGGVANNTPIGVAIDAGATEITVIFLNPPDMHVPQAITNLAEIGLTCFSIMQERILELDFQNAERVNKAIAAGSGGTGSSGVRKPIALTFVQPTDPLPISVLQFDRQDLIDQVYARGVADAKTAMLGWSTKR